ncbi:MAG: hypothetical protein K2M37_07270 [Muribaculaceae bacterium]|nr:hypothetical protein [Muribaculaceae bacterium]
MEQAPSNSFTRYLSNTIEPECWNASISSEGYSEAMTAWEFFPARSWTYQLIASRVAPFSHSHHR